MTEDRRFHDIHPSAFQHPEDVAAIKKLQAVPGLDAALKLLSRETIERAVHTINSHHAVRIGPTQYPSLWRMVEHACHCLDISPPDAYLQQEYEANANAFGMKRFTLTLYSGLVDLLDDREIHAIIGHELGHIVCEHMLYKSSADILTKFGALVAGGLIGLDAKVISAPIELALLRWSRAAELSCDRAALLVVGDPEVVASAMSKIAGGSRRFADELSVRDVIAQAESFDEEATSIDKVIDIVYHMGLTHPDPIRRAREIMMWWDSPEYRQILGGQYPSRSSAETKRRSIKIEGLQYCPACNKPINTGLQCPHADCRLRFAKQYQKRCPRNHVCDTDWRFCLTCGWEFKDALPPASEGMLPGGPGGASGP